MRRPRAVVEKEMAAEEATIADDLLALQKKEKVRPLLLVPGKFRS